MNFKAKKKTDYPGGQDFTIKSQTNEMVHHGYNNVINQLKLGQRKCHRFHSASLLRIFSFHNNLHRLGKYHNLLSG